MLYIFAEFDVLRKCILMIKEIIDRNPKLAIVLNGNRLFYYDFGRLSIKNLSSIFLLYYIVLLWYKEVEMVVGLSRLGKN